MMESIFHRPQHRMMYTKKVLQTRIGAFIELSLFFIISMLPLPVSIIIPLLVAISIGSIKIRNVKWTHVGFDMRNFTVKNISAGIAVALIYFLLFHYIVDVILNHWFYGIDLRELGNIRADFLNLLMWLVMSWTVAAIFEELIFRAYLINRLQDLIGKNRFCN